jgi:hypothetical protein
VRLAKFVERARGEELPVRKLAATLLVLALPLLAAAPADPGALG